MPNSFSIIDLPVYMIVLDVGHSARVIDFARRILDKDPQFCLRQTGVLIPIHTFLQSVLFMCLAYLNWRSYFLFLSKGIFDIFEFLAVPGEPAAFLFIAHDYYNELSLLELTAEDPYLR